MERLFPSNNHEVYSMRTQNYSYEFYKADEIPSDVVFVNYEEQIHALAGIALKTAKGGSVHSLLFGFPGTGKSEAPFALVKHVEEKFSVRFSLTMIRCDELATKMYSAQSTKMNIEELDKTVKRAERDTPALICFDEMESIWSPIMASPTRAALISWARHFLDSHKEKIMVLGITNYPAAVEISLLRRFGNQVYFDFPNLDIVEKIIRNLLGITRYKEVAYLLMEGYSNMRSRPVGKEIVQACKELRRDKRELNQITEAEMANRLLAYCGSSLATTRKVEEYETQQAPLIVKSNTYTIPFWLRAYREEKGKTPK